MRTPAVDCQNSEDLCTVEQIVKKIVIDSADRIVKSVMPQESPKTKSNKNDFYSVLKNIGSSS